MPCLPTVEMVVAPADFPRNPPDELEDLDSIIDEM